METNVNLSVVASNRKPISMIGANLGTQFFKVEARAAIADFAEQKLNVEKNGNVDLILNRTPHRYRVTSHEILSMILGQDATNTTKVYINKDDEKNSVSIPVGPNMEKIGVVTENAIAEALKGDRNIIFCDPKKLVANVNVYNMDEKARCQAAISVLQKCIAQLDSTIAENNQKAEKFIAELLNSTPTNPMASSGTVVLTSTEE